MKKHIRFFSDTPGITYLDKTMRLSYRFLFGGIIISAFVIALAYLLDPLVIGGLYIISTLGFAARGSLGLSKHLHESSLRKDIIDIPCGWDGGMFHGWKSNVVATIGVIIIGLSVGYDGLMTLVMIIAAGMLMGLGLCYYYLERKHKVKLYCFKYN